MSQVVSFACSSVCAYLVYKELSRSPSVKPKVTDSKVAHAALKPNPVIANEVTALSNARVETADQQHVMAALLSK